MKNDISEIFVPKKKTAMCECCGNEFTYTRGYNIRFCKKPECQAEKIKQRKSQAKNYYKIPKEKHKKRTINKPYQKKDISNVYQKLLRESKKREKAMLEKYGCKKS